MFHGVSLGRGLEQGCPAGVLGLQSPSGRWSGSRRAALTGGASAGSCLLVPLGSPRRWQAGSGSAGLGCKAWGESGGKDGGRGGGKSEGEGRVSGM